MADEPLAIVMSLTVMAPKKMIWNTSYSQRKTQVCGSSTPASGGRVAAATAAIPPAVAQPAVQPVVAQQVLNPGWSRRDSW